MKKILVLLLISISVASMAQIPEKKAMHIPRFAAKLDRLILNLNLDNWLHTSTGIHVKDFRSRGFSFLLMNEKVLGEGNAAVAFGFGFSSQNVHSNAFPTYNADKSKTYLSPITVDYDLNKLSCNFI